MKNCETAEVQCCTEVHLCPRLPATVTAMQQGTQCISHKGQAAHAKTKLEGNTQLYTHFRYLRRQPAKRVEGAPD